MRKIKIGIVGLGRLGIKHAENIAFKSRHAELHAICSLDDDLMARLRVEWQVPHSYSDYGAMLKNDQLDAIFIASPSAQHAEHIEQALAAGFHVFSEKPLGTTKEECLRAEAAVEKHHNQVFMLGFMRRYDASYAEAKRLIDAGQIGKPILFRGYSIDPENSIAGAIAYAPHSGGQFIDMAVHDIDLARWFLGGEAASVYAIGGSYLHPEFSKYQDGDNVAALMKFDNGTMAFVMAGRTAPHGYNVETEIIGTKATLRIASVPQKNLVEIIDPTGIRKECSQNFLERFEMAYLNELNEFVNSIIEQRKPAVTVYDGTKTTIVAYAATESFRTNQLVHIKY